MQERMAHDPAGLDQRSRLIAIVAIIVALAAIALELVYTVGAYVLGVVHRVV
jgi:hypothetical protein